MFMNMRDEDTHLVSDRARPRSLAICRRTHKKVLDRVCTLCAPCCVYAGVCVRPATRGTTKAVVVVVVFDTGCVPV